MRNYKIGTLCAVTAGCCLLLSACGTIDEDVLNTKIDTSVRINMPYATATPLPDRLNVPDAIVIDADGNVTLNDSSIIEGSFQSVRDIEEQTEYKNLSLGNTGIAVQSLQLRLKNLGYFDGAVSGLFDSDTEAAVRRFEQTYGTMQTGVANVKFQLKLFDAAAPVYGSDAYNNAVLAQYTVLRPGNVGDTVYALQRRLKSLGYPILNVSGAFDEQTAECVRLFYAAYGLPASDVADVALQRELYSENARTYDPSVQVTTTVAPGEEAQTALPEGDGEGESISLGNSGPKVSQIQQRLIDLGYMEADTATGVFDAVTQDAVNRFLTAVGVTANGMLSGDMVNYLLNGGAPAFAEQLDASAFEDLSVGDDGEAVLNLQRRLVELGYADGQPNGKYGPTTVRTVAEYQRLNRLDIDGEHTTAQLQAQIFSDQAPTYDDAVAAYEAAYGVDAQAQASADALYFNMSMGYTGAAVNTLQERLADLGYLERVTGVYDEATRDAVIAFQAAIGMPQTGEASASLQRYVLSQAAPNATVRFDYTGESYDTLRVGDSGDAVTELQRRLWELGFLDRDSVTDSVGVFNEATRQAVVDAQLKMGYTSADGVAGIEFQGFLFSRYGDMLH